MLPFDPAKYGPACAALLVGVDPMELGPGEPHEPQRAALAALTAATLAPGRKLRDPAMAASCLSGLWLLHNFLDESHRISQEISSTTGSFWHGIMHRREGDFGNAKYWFRSVGEHPVYAALAASAAELAATAEAQRDEPLELAAHFLHDARSWNAAAFVDLVAAVLRGQSAHRELCQQIALAEWRLLFDHSYTQAFTPGEGPGVRP